MLKGGGNPLQGVMGVLRFANRYPERMENCEKDFQQFGKDVCSRVVTLEDTAAKRWLAA